MTPDEMIGLLTRWRESGWLRRLDVAFARFILEQDPQAPASLLLASALVAQMEGRGHSCLPVAELTAEAGALLAWPPEALTEFTQVWAGMLSSHGGEQGLVQAWSGAVVQVEPTDGAGRSPLVLCRGRLYLRRYWRYECRVATQIRARTNVGASGGDHAVDSEAARGWLDILLPACKYTIKTSNTTASSGGGAIATSEATAEANTESTDWQKVACALALRGRLTIITGGPGTGKTYTAARLLVLLTALHPPGQVLRVALAAPTGKAAARLRQSIDVALHGLQEQLGEAAPLQEWAAQLGPARTLHALLGAQPGTRRFRHDAANPLEVDVLFVDEASMVHLEMMALLLEALPEGARVILLGDKDQLASVEAGAVLGDLCQGAVLDGGPSGYRPQTAEWVHALTGQRLAPTLIGAGTDLAQQTVVLRESRRFAGPIAMLAKAVNLGDGPGALRVLHAEDHGAVSWIKARDAGVVQSLAVSGRAGASGGYRTYLEALARRPTDAAAFDAWAMDVLVRFDGFRVLCAVREGPWGVSGLNIAIERALGERGLLRGHGEWYEGRPVMVTRNDATLGIFNGDIGVVLRSPLGEGALRAYFVDGAQLRSVSVGRLADVETAFAMTVHKSQGSEFAHVVLVLPDDKNPVMTRELVYTGLTRAREAFTLVATTDQVLTHAMSSVVRRSSGLLQALHMA